MPSWLLLQNSSGFPLFSRSYGLPSDAFSFPTMGLLSALDSAADNEGFCVKRMESHDAAIAVRRYKGGLIIFLASSDVHVSETEMSARIQRIYDAILLVVGRSKMEESPCRHVERFKKLIRMAAPLISLFLLEDTHLLQMGSGSPECCIASDPQVFEDTQSLAQTCGVRHAALYAHHRLYAWTDEWSALDSRDLFTLSCFLRSSTAAQARDVPVYLAHSSLGGSGTPIKNLGRTPYRLLTVTLLSGLELVLLCGPTPTIIEAMDAARRTIMGSNTSVASKHASHTSTSHTPMYERFLAHCIDFPRHLPNSFHFNSNILAFMYVKHRSDGDGVVNASSNARMVCSFLAQGPIPALPTPSKHSRARSFSSPSFLRRNKASQNSSTPRARIQPPPSPSSQFAPSNPLFSGSIISDSSILSRSYALIGFYHLIQPMLFPEKDAVNGQVADYVDPPSSTNGQTVTSDAYMIAQNRGFYACRHGSSSLYALLSDQTPSSTHGAISWELMKALEEISRKL